MDETAAERRPCAQAHAGAGNEAVCAGRGNSQRSIDDTQLVVCMVGLPARGKSWAAKRLQHYLTEQCGCKTQVFNVGNLRRVQSDQAGTESAGFFDASNKAAASKREALAMSVFGCMLKWLRVVPEARCGIFDATNTTEARRAWVLERCRKEGMDILFVENSCTDPKIIKDNLAIKISTSPDYVGVSLHESLTDFKERVRKYEQVYRTIQDLSLCFIKVINLAHIVSNNVTSQTQLCVLECLQEAVDLLRLQRSLKNGSRKTPAMHTYFQHASPQVSPEIKANPPPRCALPHLSLSPVATVTMPTLVLQRTRSTREWKAQCRKRESRAVCS